MGIIRFLIIIFELIICYVLQSSVCGNFTLNHTMPDLMMIIVVTVAYLKGSNAGILYGFCAGMILDLTYGTHLGFGALLYLLAGFLAGLFHKFYRKDDNITPLRPPLLTIACPNPVKRSPHLRCNPKPYSTYGSIDISGIVTSCTEK